jgi:hypothetical protein
MPRFSSYPSTASLANADTFLIHQDATGLEKQVSSESVAVSLLAQLIPDGTLTVADLRALSVSLLTTGYSRNLGGYYASADGGGGQFIYNSASTETDNGGTVIQPTVGVGRWLRPATETLNVRQFGALGDGVHDDTPAIQSAVNTASVTGNGSVYFPAGNYKIVSAITLASLPLCNISLIGDGPNVSTITQTSALTNGINFTFENVGVTQPYRVFISDLGFKCTAAAGIAIRVSYGNPVSTSSHFNSGPVIDNVAIASSDSSGSWRDGIEVESAWNTKITNTSISGNAFGAVWAALQGAGIKIKRYCVNTHISDVQINFFFTGIYYTTVGATASDGNTEGLFCSNNSIVACRRGVWLQGNPSATNPWLTGFQWDGGLIELRGGIAGIQIEACSEVHITGSYIIDGATGAGAKGVYMGTCEDVNISNNQFYAFDYGVVTVGTCKFIVASTNAFRGGNEQVRFDVGTTESRSVNNTARDCPRQELMNATARGSQNKIYQGQSYGFKIVKNAVQSVPTATEQEVTWQTEITNDLDFNVPAFKRFFNPANPTRILVPPGVTRVRVTVGIRWDTSAVGNRSIKIRTPVAGSYYVANTNWASDSRTATTLSDATVSTGVLELDPNNGNYFVVVAEQTSGGNLNIRNTEGTYIYIEIIG